MALEVEAVPTRSGTTAEWTASGLVLAVGEIGIDTTLGIQKFGDGVSIFSALAAQGGGRALVGNAVLVAGTVTVSGLTGVTTQSEAFTSTKILGTVTSAKAIKATPGTNNLVLTSSDNTDTSTVSWHVIID